MVTKHCRHWAAEITRAQAKLFLLDWGLFDWDTLCLGLYENLMQLMQPSKHTRLVSSHNQATDRGAPVGASAPAVVLPARIAVEGTTTGTTVVVEPSSSPVAPWLV